MCERIFEGSPRLLIHEGKVLQGALRKERLSKDELHAMVRKQGVHYFREFKSGILEADGSLSLVRHDDLRT
jgi:uncharacterized membrane protein YcaP (DUF421 family)